MAENKPVYRMSSCGDCARALSAERLGYPSEPAPDWLERAANEGKKHEEWIVEELRKHDVVFHRQRKVTLDFPLFTLVGHIDGKIQDRDLQRQEQLLEIKSMSQYEFDRWMKEGWSGFQSYAAQITCYMKGTGLSKVLYLIKNRSSGYIDKATLTEPPANFDEIIAKLENVENAVRMGLLVEAEYLPDSLQCRRCFYKAHCLSTPVKFEAVPESVLLQASENWRKGKALEQEAKELMESAKEKFLIQTEVSGQKKWRFNELFINKVEVKESVSYSKTNLMKVFTEEELKPASEIKLPYNYLRIDDLAGGER